MANPASIVLTGLAANYPIPGVYEEINFAVGPVGASPSLRTALLIGNKTTAGSATVETVIYGPDTGIPCQTETDVITLFGTGSQLHRAYLRFTAVNRITAVYFIAVAESAGAQASNTIVVSGTAANNGNVRVWVGDQFVDTAVTNGDTATIIGGNIAASINTQTRWSVTAANVTGTVTLTAKNHGPEGNWITYQAAITGSNITTTVTATAVTKLTGGATAD